jgi:glycosyltransferase involved in cell wall biosynthesis
MSKFNGRIVTIGYYPDPCFNPSNVDPFLVRKYKGFKVIVFDGRLIPEKGTYIMLSVADIVRRVIPNFKLLLIGGFVSHSEEKSFNRAISDLGLQNHVESVGWVTYCEVPKYINLGKLGLSLLTDWCYSYVITEPYKVLEMMSCGLPVIATNGNIVSRELIQESGGGILVDQSDIKAIADCVIRLLFDEYEANQMGLKAREFMEKTRRWSDFEEKLLSVYASLFPNR